MISESASARALGIARRRVLLVAIDAGSPSLALGDSSLSTEAGDSFAGPLPGPFYVRAMPR